MILGAKRKPAGEEPATELETESANVKTKSKISLLKLHKQFLSEIATDDKNINKQIFKEYFKYYSRSFLVKDLYKNIQNDRIVKYITKS